MVQGRGDFWFRDLGSHGLKNWGFMVSGLGDLLSGDGRGAWGAMASGLGALWPGGSSI